MAEGILFIFIVGAFFSGLIGIVPGWFRKQRCGWLLALNILPLACLTQTSESGPKARIYRYNLPKLRSELSNR